MVSPRRRQTGAGLFGWTAVILMAGTLGLIALRLVPLYIDYFHVLDVARGLQADASMASKGKTELKTIVAQRFRQNNLYKMSPTVLKFSKDKTQRLIVTIDYEERVNIFANLDMVAKFNRTLFPG